MRYVLLFLSALISTGLSAQSDPQVPFVEANTLLENGAYAEALRSYKQIEATGFESGALYLNMGITATEMDSLGLAKAYLLRAAEYAETEEQALKALDYVNSQFSRQSAILRKLPWDLAVQWMIKVPGPGGVFTAGILIVLIGLSILFGRWFGKLHSDTFKSAAIYIAGTGIVIVLLSFYADYVDARYDEAVLITEESRVTREPAEGAELINVAYEGYDLVIDRKKSLNADGWLYIRLGNGQYGWIRNYGVKTI